MSRYLHAFSHPFVQIPPVIDFESSNAGRLTFNPPLGLPKDATVAAKTGTGQLND